MGFRFGERKYSEGLYSRWPDWWRNRACLNDVWDQAACAPPVWTELLPPPPMSPLLPWSPMGVTRGGNSPARAPAPGFVFSRPPRVTHG